MTSADRPALSLATTLTYCIYAIPLVATTAAISNFIPPLYGGALGLSLPSVAAALLVIRLIDACVDPFIGLAIDRAKFRQKHRPWLLIALPLYLLGVTALFFAPVRSVSAAYLVATGAVVYIAYTMAMVVHQAWAASLADGPQAVSRLFGFRELAVIAGILGVFSFAAIASEVYGDDIGAQARAAGWFILVAISVATLITYTLTPDPHGPNEAGHSASARELWALLSSRNFILLLIAVVAFNGGWMSLSTIGFFVAKYLYGAPEVFALGLTISFVVAPIGMILWMRLAGKLGDQRTLVISCVYLALVMLLIPVLSSHGKAGLIGFYVLMGFGFGAGPYLTRAITGIVANEYVERTGFDVRGTAFAATTFFDKLGSGVGASALIALGWLGFDPKLEATTAGTHALLLVGTAVPASGFILTALLIHAMRLARANRQEGD